MYFDGQRTLLGALLWAAAALSAPFATLLWVQYGSSLPAIGGGLLSLLLFASALLCSSLNQHLDELGEHSDTDRTPNRFEDTETDSCSGLRVLRIGKGSPLRGHIIEQAVILKVNGIHPATAEQANQALVEGRNEIEWMGRNGKVLMASIVTDSHDLLAQFEQLNPHRRNEGGGHSVRA